jgi:hypothetical protein
MVKREWKILILVAIALLVITACYPILYSLRGTAGAETGGSGADNIQLLYFHRTQRCVSCNNAEAYARETLDRYYANELNSGKIAIQSIDYQTDKAMAEKYGVKMQGLKMVITRNGQQTVKDVPEVWAFVKDKESCISCLKAALDKELGK